jgi:pimeloyl-ACP methyl ester carboxylesterase
MSPIARHLRTTGLATYEMEYASTRGHFRDHVAALADVVKHLPMHARLSVVTHSMGGLVLRGYMQQYGERHAAWHRVVMIAPPNEGSAVARGLNRLPVVGTAFRLVMGRSGRSIAEWRDLPTMLAKQMPVPTLVLAATTWPLQGHDGILSADETRLTAAEYVEVPGNHTFVLNDAAVHDRVASYLYDAACD